MKFVQISSNKTFYFTHIGDGFYDINGSAFSESALRKMGYRMVAETEYSNTPNELQFGDSEALGREFNSSKYRHQKSKNRGRGRPKGSSKYV